MLAQWHEGNLLALVQSLEKLALLYPDGELNMVRVEESLSRHNHFTPFHWMDALLAGKPKRAQRILRQLELEGIEPVILLRTLQRELTLIAKLKSELQSLALGALFEKHRIWQSKRPLYNATLQRLDISKIRQLLQDLAAAEVLSKTQYETPVWPALAQLSLLFCSDSSVSFSNIQHRA
jgi:DNA polymerase-3 subunit delta